MLNYLDVDVKIYIKHLPVKVFIKCKYNKSELDQNIRTNKNTMFKCFCSYRDELEKYTTSPIYPKWCFLK